MIEGLQILADALHDPDLDALKHDAVTALLSMAVKEGDRIKWPQFPKFAAAYRKQTQPKEGGQTNRSGVASR